MNSIRTRAALGALLTAMMLPPTAQATMPVQHDCALRDPVADAPTTRRVSPARAAGTPAHTLRDYSIQAASLLNAHARVRLGSARELVGDRNLQGMLESAVGDIETLTQVIGTDTLAAMRNAENARRPPQEFQARVIVVFDDDSSADFIATTGYPIAKYIIGSARGADGTRLADERCSTTVMP